MAGTVGCRQPHQTGSWSGTASTQTCSRSTSAVPPRTGVGQEDPHLAVRDAPRRPAVLPRHPRRVRALLQEPGLVDDAHPGCVRQVVADMGLQGIPARVRRPSRPPQQVPEAVGLGLALDLGQLFLRGAGPSRPSM